MDHHRIKRPRFMRGCFVFSVEYFDSNSRRLGGRWPTGCRSAAKAGAESSTLVVQGPTTNYHHY